MFSKIFTRRISMNCLNCYLKKLSLPREHEYGHAHKTRFWFLLGVLLKISDGHPVTWIWESPAPWDLINGNHFSGVGVAGSFIIQARLLDECRLFGRHIFRAVKIWKLRELSKRLSFSGLLGIWKILFERSASGKTKTAHWFALKDLTLQFDMQRQWSRESLN